MARAYTICAPNVGRVAGCLYRSHHRAHMDLSDRVANGEAFAGEYVARLPRRFTRGRKNAAALHNGWLWDYAGRLHFGWLNRIS